MDPDRSALSRDYLHRFIESGYFDFQGYVAAKEAADVLLQSGKVRAVIVVPEQFQERLSAGTGVGVQTLIDGTFPLRTGITNGYVIALTAAFIEELLITHLARSRAFPAGRRRRWLGQSRPR